MVKSLQYQESGWRDGAFRPLPYSGRTERACFLIGDEIQYGTKGGRSEVSQRDV